MTKPPPPCTYSAEAGWMKPEHRSDCKGATCRGCRPCPESHCALHGRCANHVKRGAGEYTCVRCIGKTRKVVREIATRYAELPAEYEFSGVESEVLNLHGPSADPGQWAARRSALSAIYAERGWCDFPKHAGMAEDDPHHPLAVLGRWDIAIRESYAHTSDLFVTISSAVDYLAGDVLDTFAHTREFEEFAKEARACLSHLEDVLALSQRPEQGAPCPTCSAELATIEVSEGEKRERAPRLVKRLAEHPPGWFKGEGARICGVEKCKTCSGEFDTWHCPRDPAHHWDHVSYRSRVDGAYVDHALDLPARELAERLGVPPSTVRSWISPRRHVIRGVVSFGEPRLKPAGAIAGRKTYSVEAAQALLKKGSASA